MQNANNENYGGMLMRLWMEEHSICAPATIHPHHSGQSHTWQSNKGGKFRIDFIGIPMNLMNPSVKSYVDAKLDVVHSVRDHFPSFVVVGPCQATGEPLVKRRAAIMSRSAIADPAAQRQFIS